MFGTKALNVMEGEVNRVLVLSQHAVIPLPYIVPRKVSPTLCLVPKRALNVMEGEVNRVLVLFQHAIIIYAIYCA